MTNMANSCRRLAENKVAELLGTQDKKLARAVIVKTLVEEGVPMRDAFEFAFGLSYDMFAGHIYDQLRAKSQG
jgi:hypothetical protein